ncbi:WD-40 repeat-containing protein, partial [Reticulomyxa filosa]
MKNQKFDVFEGLLIVCNNKKKLFPIEKKLLLKSIFFIIFVSLKIISRKKKMERRYFSLVMRSKEEEIQIIIHHWIRTLNIQLGWIKDFEKLVVNYVHTIFMFDTFRSSSKLINTFNGHTKAVWSIDYSTFDNCQFICSGSTDETILVCDVDNNKQIQSFSGHSSEVYCVKFSSYHYHNHRQYVICSSSFDKPF